MTKPHAPLTFSRVTPALTVFLAKFASHMTERRFHAALRDNAGFARQALPAFDLTWLTVVLLSVLWFRDLELCL